MFLLGELIPNINMCALNFLKVIVPLNLNGYLRTDYLILGSNLFVESVIDLALKSAVWQL